MAHTEPWQIFSPNGEPVRGKGAPREAFDTDKALGVGASHVWVWRRKDVAVEVLLQRRASDKVTWPGYIDISTAGHIDTNESPAQSAVREAMEEIGLPIPEEDLFYIFSLRTPLDRREIDFVYLYELKRDVEFRFDDGEVDELQWVTIDTLEHMTAHPDDYKLVPQGNEYFALLLQNLRQVAYENH